MKTMLQYYCPIATLLSLSFLFTQCDSDDQNVDLEVPDEFIAKDSLIGNNFFQVEFSTDMRSMVYCEQILTLQGQALIWYAAVDLNTGLPNLAGKQLVDTIKSNGWLYSGNNTQGRFFLYENRNNHVKTTRRVGVNTLLTSDYGTIDNRAKALRYSRQHT